MSPKSTAWSALSLGAGALAAFGMRKLVAMAWPGSTEPPLNPADRRVNWSSALVWGIASGIGAGVARVVSSRLAAAGWEHATGETPPGIRPDAIWKR
ncbi:MAG: DUF4235 domain-containing protein [Ilumatobacteraceae bacterium]